MHDFPGIGAIQPVVWPLLLPSIANALVEHAVLVAQSVTHCRKLQGRHRIEEARRQTTEPAISETGIRFFVKQLDPLTPIVVEGPLDHGIELEIHDVVGERAADEEFDRHIVDPLRVFAAVGFIRVQPAVRKNVPYRASSAFIAFPRVGGLRFDDIVGLQMPFIERVWRPREARRAATVLLQELSPLRGVLLLGFDSGLSYALH